ncbi:MAG TPA: hypothetical protein VIG99_15185 [Myxococcaceae bacterium]|jgi:hypothetical protein
MRRLIAFIVATLVLGWACGASDRLAFSLEQPADLPRPPTTEAPGLTSDLVPPGYQAG